jgi:hypothetical protein
MATQNIKKPEPTTSANQQTSQALSEAVIDWSPLLQWSPITLNIQSKKIRLAQGEINNLSSRMILKRKDQSHHIQQQHTSTLAITLPNGMSFNHPIVLSTDWQTLGPTTQGADIKGSTQLTFGDSQFTLDGKLNLNHRMQEEILLTMHLEQFPFKANSNSAKKLKQQSALLLPFSASTQLHFKDQQLQLSSLMVKAKKSDITGDITLDVNTQANKRKTLRFDLTSQKLVIPHGSTPKTNKKKTGSLFTNDKIATNWLNTMNIDGNIRIKTVWYKNHAVLAGVDNHIRLNKKTFTLKNTTKNIGKGTANFTVSLSHKNNTLRLKTSGSAKKILLEALQLVPKEELSGGKTNASFSLSSYGNSTKSLASHLQGKLLLTATDGVITNNSFEAIGSDLLLKIVNTINPFYKESKTTDLECAVIKAKITDGKMLFDDSIAIKTSKMIIIGDGNINLATEKINVGINPKARAGVGIDVASLAKFIAIQGDLSAPSIGVSGTGTAKSLLSIGAAISTGGLSLLATKIADAVISGDACKVAENAFNA